MKTENKISRIKKKKGDDKIIKVPGIRDSGNKEKIINLACLMLVQHATF